MKHRMILMFVVLASGACFAWSQKPASSQVASNSPGQSTLKIETVPIHRFAPHEGQQMYASHCAPCHGSNAKGEGPAAAAVSTKIPDLTTLAARNGGRYPKDRVVLALSEFNTAHRSGSSEMPDWYPAFRSLNRSCPYNAHVRALSIAKYLESLQVQKE